MQRKPGTLPVESHRTLTPPPNCKSWQHLWNIVHEETSLETQSQGFYGGWSYRHSLPSISQNSRSLEAKQVFSITLIVSMSSLGTVTHTYQEWWELFQNPLSQMSAKGHHDLFSNDSNCQMRRGAPEGKVTSQQEKREGVGQPHAPDWTKRTRA